MAEIGNVTVRVDAVITDEQYREAMSAVRAANERMDLLEAENAKLRGLVRDMFYAVHPADREKFLTNVAELGRTMAEYVVEEPSDRSASWRVRERIVRCRDCERFAVDQSDHEYRSGWWCKRWDTDMVKPDGFCAWGERKESE